MSSYWKHIVGTAACAALILAGCQKSESPSPGSASAPAPTVDAHPPVGILDTPREGSTVEGNSWGTGWALDDSGILQVTAKFDNGTVTVAKIGQAFPGVAAAYPNMADNDKAGFIFAVPALPAGAHSVTVEIIAKDGGKLELKRQFQLK